MATTCIARAMLDSHFNLYFHEKWGSREIDDAVAILQKVAAQFQVT